MTTDGKTRCPWAIQSALMQAYHDEEWGVPCHDDTELFERLVLESFQAGLAWSTILRKRDHFRQAFDAWDIGRVAAYGPADIARLMQDTGIVRNRLKIEAAIQNARCVLQVQQEYGSLDSYIWSFVEGQPLQRPVPPTWEAVLPFTPESQAMARAMRRRGFRFVGPTMCYAFMQSIGMVNDHIEGCFRAASTSPT